MIGIRSKRIPIIKQSKRGFNMKENLVSEELIPILKKHGLRITPQRIQILETIIAEGHPTVEDIARHLPNMSIATIYNNVKQFVSMKIVHELPYGNGISRYELFKTNNYHVICQSCGVIVDFTFPSLREVEEIASSLTKYKVHRHNMEIYGFCGDCQHGASR